MPARFRPCARHKPPVPAPMMITCNDFFSISHLISSVTRHFVISRTPSPFFEALSPSTSICRIACLRRPSEPTSAPLHKSRGEAPSQEGTVLEEKLTDFEGHRCVSAPLRALRLCAPVAAAHLLA